MREAKEGGSPIYMVACVATEGARSRKFSLVGEKEARVEVALASRTIRLTVGEDGQVLLQEFPGRCREAQGALTTDWTTRYEALLDVE